MTDIFLNVTIPVLNEAFELRANVLRLQQFLSDVYVDSKYEIVIADNGSTDGTWDIATELAKEVTCISIIRLAQRGRGRAIRESWGRSLARILMYMDVDLSTELAALPRFVKELETGRHAIAIGSRTLHPAWTTRGWKRELASRTYNWILQRCFATRFSDAQCGFKAITREAAARLLPLVQDQDWFFDTELLIMAERLNYPIYDYPVRWTDSADSRVRILATAINDLKGLWRLRRSMWDARVASPNVIWNRMP